jgi:hypothetical protein
MQAGLAEAWRSRVAGQAAESDERLEAEHNLANSLLHQGMAVEAEPMLSRLHEVEMRVHGAEHPNTLSVAGNLALSLSNQGKYADAERIEREALGVQTRVRGGMRVGGGEQRVLSMPGGAVLFARVPAHGLEGAQADLHGGTAMSVCVS